MLKFAAKLLSVSLIPIPRSAYLIAMISFAPSPTMAIFYKVRPNILYNLDLSFLSTFFIYISFRTTNALDSGVILANILAFFGIN